MKKRYKLKISYNTDSRQFVIELFKQVTRWRWSWWWSSMMRVGNRRDIDHYAIAWQREFNIAPGDVEDTRECAV